MAIATLPWGPIITKGQSLYLLSFGQGGGGEGGDGGSRGGGGSVLVLGPPVTQSPRECRYLKVYLKPKQLY